jgi:hypothetical protein
LAERQDRELVILARQGDKAAFGCLIERYQALALRVAVRMVGAPEAAQDLVQEVDARPSDVLALAVRAGCPILVSEEVMQRAGQDLAAYESEAGQLTPGDGVESILKDFEEKLKQAQAAHKAEDEEAEVDKTEG